MLAQRQNANNPEIEGNSEEHNLEQENVPQSDWFEEGDSGTSPFQIQEGTEVTIDEEHEKDEPIDDSEEVSRVATIDFYIEQESEDQEGLTRNREAFHRRGSETEDEPLSISISQEDLEGQFQKLQDELALSNIERRMVESAIRELVEETVEERDIEMSEDMRQATANVIASTLRQEYRHFTD